MPFVITIVATTLFSAYMLLDPAVSLSHLMQLTPMEIDFKVVILTLVFAGLVCAWVAERQVFPRIARVLGKCYETLFPRRRKKRKEYKRLLVDMQI